MSLSRLIGGFVRRHWQSYASSAAMLVGVAICTVLIPRKVGAMVDALAANRLGQHDLLLGIAELVALGAAIYVLRVCWRIRLYSAAYNLGVELRTRLYARLAAQGPAFYQRQRTGDLMALATNDIDAIEMAAGEALLAAFDGTLTLVMVLGIMMLGVDWRLALVALLPFPLMGLAFWYISTHIHTAEGDALKRFSALNDHVQESLSGVRTLRALGLEGRSANQFGELAGNAAQASLTAQKWEAAYEPAVGLTLTAATGLTLGLGGYLVWQNELTVGALTSFTMYLGQLIWPMFAAGWVLTLIERGRAGLARLQPLLDAPLSVEDTGTVGQVGQGPLVLDKVTFAYGGQGNLQQPALDGVSLRLEPGHTLGLVGPTGSGKSTLLRVLLRQATPQAGRAEWAGQALDAYRLSALRSATSWVPQESFLFSATIAENIALARPGASRAEVIAAAQMADIHDDILRFPHGYDTPVGEKGITLSGGQRQRVAIARSLLADSRLLLLDDALSAVDTGTETRILEHLAELRRVQPGRAAIIASHRLSSVVAADHIVVLKAGRVVEAGTHDQLLALDGWYASQWRYQQLEASLDAI
ncbi:ABC transporter transmembrane domain-containing protein [Massilia sp. CFBP9012]|uniref:ABC transporter ATP-binding protein n=1 Tax=Massilia sp. CFBP9012 TaxID=3096531 RepID=UPI002A69D433|nr:ABC transporter transmembrane domain-containing protein [Massilia sp. CFBP9012]MDY0978008.1 ABC transporter transmembrane domain-containing protein [Massilia sp. CFBP9012]